MNEESGMSILLVDDENNIKLLETILSSQGYILFSAHSGEDALAVVNDKKPDLILLEIMMPDINGFEVMRQLKSHTETSLIPIILLTVLSDQKSRLKGLTAGGAEFLSKPVDHAELLVRVKNLLKLKTYQNSLLKHNITLSEKILWLTHFDPLTCLPNRTLLMDRVTQALQLARCNKTNVAVMFLDLNHFKNINDTLGHEIGDLLLIAVAERLKIVAREEDILSRQGGDEFILVLPNTDVNAAASFAKKILQSIAESIQIKHHELNITASIGISIFPGDGDSFETLFKHADIAMYLAKNKSNNHFCFFSDEMQADSTRSLELENALTSALKYDQLYLHFQPQISLQTRRIVGAEALLRWRHPKLGLIGPDEFIPVAERCGLIQEIGEWVLRASVKQLKTWIEGGLEPIVIAVNLSVAQFRNPHLVEFILKMMGDIKLSNHLLALELTESVAMDDPVLATNVLNQLHELGFQIAIDDFGTGFSSLSYLSRFHVNKLKIDRSFVSQLTHDNEIIVSAIINLARSLGIDTIAEGVETEAQLAFLEKNSCDEIQGDYFSKPLPAEQFLALVQRMQKK